MKTRIEQLQQFILDEPADPFNHYALALEYQKTDPQKAITIFEKLVIEHSTYVPTYYHLAKLYERMSRKENALQLFDRGIEVAKQQSDFRTLRELHAAREELLEDE